LSDSAVSSNAAPNRQLCFKWYIFILALAIISAFFTVIPASGDQPLSFMRSLLGIVFVLFLPGFCFVKALFPNSHSEATRSQRNMGNVERFSLSVAMSLVFTPMVLLVLNCITGGIALMPIAIGLLAVTIFFATVALAREIGYF
jgi:uncharacterized membrane protein